MGENNLICTARSRVPPNPARAPQLKSWAAHGNHGAAQAQVLRTRTMTNTPTAGQRISFHAQLEDWAEGMDYCAVRVPAEITKALGTRGPVLVLARVNDSEPFQVSLFPVGGGQHYIRIKAKVRRETNTKTGDRIQVRLTVLDRADIDTPEDLVSALRAENAEEAFKSLPPGKRNFLVRRIDEAAKPETRERRIQEAVVAAHQRREKLLSSR
jgi:hypothetical protein